MQIKQFKDKPLAHYAYAVVSENLMAVIDPGRDPLPYYRYAEACGAKIVAVFETHPHADFVSGHLQIHQETGAKIYVSKLLDADYEHQSFDDGARIRMGEVIFTAVNTPGHSPDSITIAVQQDQEIALFTGDTLFIGDVGRPDLRENVGAVTAERRNLAGQMYHSIRHKFSEFPDEALIYPAHGAGSLCGKNMSDESVSTLGQERRTNWAFREQSEAEFVENILEGQPFIPHYFGFNVDLNKQGAPHIRHSIAQVSFVLAANQAPDEKLIVDTREASVFKTGHLPGSINIMCRSEADKFETWLGAIVKPGEPFHLVLNAVADAEVILSRVAKIGYERQLDKLLTLDKNLEKQPEPFDHRHFRDHPEEYTVVDVRNSSEVASQAFFKEAVSIPLHELRQRAAEIPKSKPVVVHCAAGYRSAAGISIIQREFPELRVYDLGEAIKSFPRI